MRTFRLRSVGVAVALIAGVAGGAQIVGVQPALAQEPAFVISRTRNLPWEIRAGEKVPLGKIFNIQQVVPGARILSIEAKWSVDVQINGLGSPPTPFVFANLDELRAATVTATKDGDIDIQIFAHNFQTDNTASKSTGFTFLRFVAPLVQAIGFVPVVSPPAVSAGEKVPLGKFLTTEVYSGPPKITNITFQASGGVQLNGLSIGALPPTLEALAAAPVTASSDGGLTFFVDYTVPSGGNIASAVPYRTGGSILVKFIAPVPVPAPPAPAPAPAPGPAPGPAPAPPPAAGGVPVVGGGNRVPVAQSTALVAVAGAVSPLTLQGSDPDANALTFVVVQFPVHGKLSGQAPNLSYTPDRGFVGTDALIFTASDGTASSAQATVTITVTGKAVSIARTVSRAVRRTVKKTTKKR